MQQSNPVVQTLFHIPFTGNELNRPELSLIAGDAYIAYAITGTGGTDLRELTYCKIGTWDDESIRKFYTEYTQLQKQFSRIRVSYDLADACLGPSSLPGKVYSQFLNRQNASAFTENIPGWQLDSTVLVPDSIQQLIGDKFREAGRYSFLPLLFKTPAGNSTASLRVDFKMEQMTVVALRNNRLLLAQYYDYSSPEDATYYLLSIFKQLSLSQDETVIIVSGLLEKNSELFKMLFQFFRQIDWADSGWELSSAGLPPHYFSVLNILTQCA